MAKKDEELKEAGERLDKKTTFNPLLQALHDNDKKNLFKTNVTTAFIKTGFPLFDYYFGSVINIHDELGKIVKQEARVGQAAGTFNLVIGATGSGKCEPISTRIPTPDGWKRMGDIKAGDYVFTDDGSPAKVLGAYPQGVKDVYKITFGDGRTALCSEEHLWPVIFVSHGVHKSKVMPLKEIMKDYKNFDRPEIRGRRYCIPCLCAPVQYPHKDVPVDPYTLGALIGNGVLGENELTISSGTWEVPEKICRRNGFSWYQRNKSSYSWYFYDDGMSLIKTEDFFEDLPEMIGKKSAEKRIPRVYLENDYETRIELLRGLMDTDGTICYAEGRYNVSYSSNSIGLLQDILELIQSLGYTGNIGQDKRVGKYANGYHGSLHFQVPNSFKPEMFTVSWKTLLALNAVNHPQRRNYNMTHIREIKFDHKEECQCIYVDSPSHLYLTDQFIITHNTTWAAQIAANIIRQYKYGNVIHFDCENRFDLSRAETITKLPASYFDPEQGERYMIRSGMVGLDTIQEMVVKTYVSKMKLKDQLLVSSGFKDEFGRDVMIFEPTVIIIDSITTVLNETFNPDNAKEASDAEKMRGNTEGARDAKTMKGFFKDILPMCKEANIIIYGINHINTNMSMNAFIPVARQQNYLKQDESIPGGKTMLYYPFNIIKLTAKPSDDFTAESDGVDGHVVMVEPVKSSSNQSGNNAHGISFELVFTFKYGFDSLRSMVLYGREHGLIEGNKNRLKFKDDPSFTFSFKDIDEEKKTKPIWKCINTYIVPSLNEHLPFLEPGNGNDFDDESLAY